MAVDSPALATNGHASRERAAHAEPVLPSAETRMHVRKRNGRLEPVDVNKIVRAVQRSAGGLPHVDIMRIAVKTIGGLFDGATTRELDRLSIQTAASLIAEEPEYSQPRGPAARLLHRQGGDEPGHPLVLPGDRRRPPPRPDRRRDGPVRRGGRPQAERRRGPVLRPVRVLRPADGLRPLPAPPPDLARRHRDPRLLLPAGGLRPVAHRAATPSSCST